MLKKLVIFFYLCPAVVFALNNDLDVNLLYISDPGDSFENTHAELDYDLFYKHVEENVDAPFKNSYKNYSVVQGLNYSFDFGLYLATYFDYLVTAPELYISYGVGGNYFSLGRKKPNTELYIDQIFKIGVDQAFQRNNPFQAESQGRLSFNYIFKSESIIFEAFASPFSIPDQGASYEISDGKIRSKNPWSSLPPASLELDGVGEFNLNYRILNDSLPEVLGNAQYGLNFSVVSDYLKVDGFYHNKTSKQIGFKIAPLLDSDQVGVVDIDTSPFFAREHLFGVQLKSMWLKGFEVTNGFYGLVLNSEQEEAAAGFQTELNDYFFMTTAFHLTFDWAKLTIAHLYRSQRSFELDKDTVYLDSNRFLHGNAIKLTLSDVSLGDFNFVSDILFATQDKGLSGQFYLSYSLSKNFSLTSQLNIIEDFNDNSSFESRFSETTFFRFSTLDNFRMGVHYVF